MSRLLTITHLTLFEARRRWMVAAAFFCGLAFLLVYGGAIALASRELAHGGVTFVERQVSFAMFTVVGLYAVNFLTVMFALLLPIDALSGEIASGVIQTLAVKPIRRTELVLGKWLAYWIMVSAYLLLLAGGVIAAAWLATGFLQLHIREALPLMLLEATLLMTVSLAGGARLPTVTNGIVAFGFYGLAFIGGWVEQIGAMMGVHTAREIGVAVSLVSPADTLWRLGAYYLQPALVRDVQGTPFGAASVPNALMVAWAAGFTLLALIVGIRAFEKRAL
jgi:ABC-2 type transport system permease protein